MDGQKSPSTSDTPRLVLTTMNDDLAVCKIMTKERAVYVLPDVSRSQLVALLPEYGRYDVRFPSLMICNFSSALLNIPMRIVYQIYVGEDLLWQAPS